jgi:tetratricopeptide (TPR) repeat protein
LKALEAAPEVGALYLEAAEVELSAGLTERAALHADRATELDAGNANAYRILGEAHYAGSDLAGAYEAYQTAVELSPRDVELQERFEVIERAYQEEHLPPEYLEIRDAERVTRAELAALIYLELRSSFDGVSEGASVIATDIGTHWAATFIRHVLGVGILEVYANHTFQPQGFVRRLELAEALARAVELLAPEAYGEALDSPGLEQSFPDLAASNPHFEAGALAVSLGLVTVSESGDFEPQGFVSGAGAVSAVEALAAHLTP